MLRYFTQDGEDWVIDPRLQQIVRFQEENILKPRTEKGQFDIILCRNVLMYFAPETRSIAYAKLEQALQDDGLLMLGAAETVMDQTTLFSTAREMRGLHCKACRAGPAPLFCRHRSPDPSHTQQSAVLRGHLPYACAHAARFAS